MFRIIVFIFLASAVEGQYAWPASQAKQGNRQIPNAMRASQRLNQASLGGLPFAAPMERFQAFATKAAEAEETAPVAAAEAEGESSTATAVAEPPASAAQSNLNIFGEATQECADGQVSAFAKDQYCAYESFSPKLCVDVPPLKEAVMGIKRIGAIGARCVSVWDLEPTPIRSEDTQGQFTLKSLNLKCGALPIDVLNSEYTLSEFNNAEMYQKSYDSLFRPGFLYYGKWPADPVTSKMTKMTRHAIKFRKAINAICNTCADAAPNAGAKAALQATCAAYSTPLTAAATDAESAADVSSTRVTATNCAALGALVGTAFAFARGIQQQRKLERTGDEYLLAA